MRWALGWSVQNATTNSFVDGLVVFETKDDDLKSAKPKYASVRPPERNYYSIKNARS